LITRVSSQARQLARSRVLSSTTAPVMFYGVVLVNNVSPSYAALTWGTSASKANILMRVGDSTKPVCKLNFNRNVTLMLDNKTLDEEISTGELGWMYQYRTGVPIITNSLTASSYNIGAKNLISLPPPAVGTVIIPGTETISKTLSVQTIDGRYKAAVAIYQIGVPNIQEY
jgi:hypothetical protein